MENVVLTKEYIDKLIKDCDKSKDLLKEANKELVELLALIKNNDIENLKTVWKGKDGDLYCTKIEELITSKIEKLTYIVDEDIEAVNKTIDKLMEKKGSVK